MVQMNLFAGQKLRHRCREQTYGHQGGKWWVGGGGSSEAKCHLRNESKVSWPQESRARPGVFSMKFEWA